MKRRQSKTQKPDDTEQEYPSAQLQAYLDSTHNQIRVVTEVLQAAARERRARKRDAAMAAADRYAAKCIRERRPFNASELSVLVDSAMATAEAA